MMGRLTQRLHPTGTYAAKEVHFRAGLHHATFPRSRRPLTSRPRVKRGSLGGNAEVTIRELQAHARGLPLACLAIVGLVSACQAPKPAPPRVAYAATDLDVRAAPSAAAPLVARVRTGTAIAVGRCDAGWCGVTVAPVTGFAAEVYLSDSPPAGPVAQQDTGRGYRNTFGEWVRSPTRTADGLAPPGATATCRDGTFSFSNTRRGTCSSHGGVARWLPRADSIRRVNGRGHG